MFNPYRVIKQKAKLLNHVTALHTALPVAPRIKPVFFFTRTLSALLTYCGRCPFSEPNPVLAAHPLRFLQVLVLSPHISSSPRFGYSGSLKFIPWDHWGSIRVFPWPLCLHGSPLTHQSHSIPLLYSVVFVSRVVPEVVYLPTRLLAVFPEGERPLSALSLTSWELLPCTPRELSKSCGLNEERNFSLNLIRKADLFFLSLKFNYFLFSDVKCESSVHFCSQSVK